MSDLLWSSLKNVDALDAEGSVISPRLLITE